ncbi:MAG: HEAT repeat domain-containing protein [Myxococcota bacterium]|nr:HEAT repeat domain-containing protein [Myxococcota bacterium]
MIGVFLLAACSSDPSGVVMGLQSDNPVVREDMVLVARGVVEPAVTQALIGVLDDTSSTVRLRAVESLAAHEDTDAVPGLIQRLSDEDAEVRAAAIDALGVLADPRAVAPLIAVLQNRQPGDYPLNAIWALGNIGDPQAIPLLSQLREHPNPYVVFNAESALRKLPATVAAGPTTIP